MQNIEQQAQKNGVALQCVGRCQFCGSDTDGGVFECFDVFNTLPSEVAVSSQFVYADAHCLQHPEVHGTWNNHFHLTRLYLILEKEIIWDHSKTPYLSRTLDKYKLSREKVLIPTLPKLERGKTTVTNLVGLQGNEIELMIGQWARDVYQAYERFHPIAKVVGGLYLLNGEKNGGSV